MYQIMTLIIALVLSGLSRSTKGLLQKGCGQSATNIRAKIVGGKKSRPGMWPWQVGIHRQSLLDDSRYDIICGGALIDPQWVVTAAHCFYQRRISSSRIWFEADIMNPKKYKIIAGDINTQIIESFQQERYAFEVYIHPSYRHAPYYENDIALIKLNKPVTTSNLVGTVCLPDGNIDLAKPGTVGTVAGWGRTMKALRSTLLLHTTVTIRNNTVCNKATQYYFNNNATFCAGGFQGSRDSCKGDSGGSLVRQVFIDGHTRWVTVGLVSWGEWCGLPGKYGYYTRIHSFLNWIKDTIAESASSCGDPGDIVNGQLIGNFQQKRFINGSRVTYKCGPGYILKGKSGRKCKGDGKWTRPPVCIKERHCPFVGHPRHGIRRPNKRRYSYKDKIRFYCVTNHVMIGRSYLTCQIDGRWNGYPPLCLAPCPDPGIPKHGVRLGANFKHGQTVRFICKKNTIMVGSRYIICNNGRWVNRIPKCYIDYSACGESLTNLRARIVGGNRAGRGTWPWQVGIYKQIQFDDRPRLLCAGALIDKQWVLTVANSFYGMNYTTSKREKQITPVSKYIIKLGDDVIDVKDPAQIDLKADAIFIHPNFKDSPLIENDIALVRLPIKVKLGPFVRTICLPNAHEKLAQPGKHGIVAGWGSTQVVHLGQSPSSKKRISKYLRHSAFIVQNQTICAQTPYHFNPNVTFCAGHGRGGNDTCAGDGGSSFIRELPRGGVYRWFTTGLVSWGEGCGLKGKYAYYTRLEPFIDWIKKTIDDN